MTAVLPDIDPFSLEVLRDPYPTHRLLREAGPVVRLERSGIWATAR
jgi:4-methoxybenzoate monooxygenase (O-demethylating)